MTLYSISGQGRTREITYIPHEVQFNMWRFRLRPDQIETIHGQLRAMFDGNEVHTAGWRVQFSYGKSKSLI